jgi:hypothetical protein
LNTYPSALAGAVAAGVVEPEELADPEELAEPEVLGEPEEPAESEELAPAAEDVGTVVAPSGIVV